jgi:probable rRNA maturation factor
MSAQINFFCEKVRFRLAQKEKLMDWIIRIISLEGKKAGDINFIFCSDPYLKSMNKEYLKHNYETDVITFDNSVGDILGGDIYISIDRVRINAAHYKVTVDNELHRVMIHGVLHLAGYNDSNDQSAALMRKAENQYLEILEL